MTIKTFRGLLADGAQDTIRLSTKQGKIGYKIVNFQLIGRTPGSMTIESVVKIYKVSQTTIDGTVNFSDNTLLGAGFYMTNSSSTYPTFETIIFDNEIFNQDIYVTAFDASTGEYINYYLELEVMNLNDNEAAVSTLMDIRGS